MGQVCSGDQDQYQHIGDDDNPRSDWARLGIAINTELPDIEMPEIENPFTALTQDDAKKGHHAVPSDSYFDQHGDGGIRAAVDEDKRKEIEGNLMKSKQTYDRELKMLSEEMDELTEKFEHLIDDSEDRTEDGDEAVKKDDSFEITDELEALKVRTVALK